MQYNVVREMDISNGPGVRVSIFFQGCPFHCKGCFNENTWDFNGGKEYTEEIKKQVLACANKDYINGLSILGGEPLCPTNIDATIELAKAFKEKYPNKTVWVWSGYLFENISNKNLFNYIDVLVDGQFKQELKDFRLHFCGSSNQRVIDVQKTLKTGNIVLYTE